MASGPWPLGPAGPAASSAPDDVNRAHHLIAGTDRHPISIRYAYGHEVEQTTRRVRGGSGGKDQRLSEKCVRNGRTRWRTVSPERGAAAVAGRGGGGTTVVGHHYRYGVLESPGPKHRQVPVGQVARIGRQKQLSPHLGLSTQNQIRNKDRNK